MTDRWEELHVAFRGLSKEDMLEPGVVGPWSIRDLLVHVALHGIRRPSKALPIILNGGRLPRYSDLYGGIDAFNAQTQQGEKGLTLDEVLTEFEETHRRLLAYLEGVPDETFASEGRFLRRLRQDTYGHYREHTEQIRVWCKGRSG